MVRHIIGQYHGDNPSLPEEMIARSIHAICLKSTIIASESLLRTAFRMQLPGHIRHYQSEIDLDRKGIGDIRGVTMVFYDFLIDFFCCGRASDSSG